MRRTMTGQSGRGKGFPRMKRFVENSPDGELLVYSNRGKYLYSSGPIEDFSDGMESLGGTLVLWRLRPPAAAIAEGATETNE